MVKALFPTPPAEKAKQDLQLDWRDQMFMRSAQNSLKDQTFDQTRANQHKDCELPPTTTSLYSVMAYKGQIIRDFPSHTREVC